MTARISGQQKLVFLSKSVGGTLYDFESQRTVSTRPKGQTSADTDGKYVTPAVRWPGIRSKETKMYTRTRSCIWGRKTTQRFMQILHVNTSAGGSRAELKENKTEGRKGASAASVLAGWTRKCFWQKRTSATPKNRGKLAKASVN